MIRNRQRADHSQALTVVIKLGTSSILNEETLQPQLSILSSIAETVCALRKQGHQVVIVSSGAIAYGLKRMGMTKKPKAIPEKQVRAQYMFTGLVTCLGTTQLTGTFCFVGSRHWPRLASQDLWLCTTLCLASWASLLLRSCSRETTLAM